MSFSGEAHLRLPVSERDHRQGRADAPVTLVEYGDYECPYCGQAQPIVKHVQQQMGDRLQFAFRNFPLTNVHPHAQQAAEAAESAGAQGKFWEMHDALYEHQQDLTTSNLLRLGEAAGVDVAKMRQDLETGAFEDRVYEDFMSGVRSGVNGTPSFFINGVRYDGAWDDDTLLAVVQDVAKHVR